MTTQALLITASGGLFALVLLGWIWWRMNRRTRRDDEAELGQATQQEIKSPRVR